MNFHPGRRLSHLAKILVVVFTVGASSGAPGAERWPKPIFTDNVPVRTPESLKDLSLPNTTIESVAIDTTNRVARVTAIVMHPPATNRIKVWIALPLTNWNARVQGNGGGGVSGGSEGSARGAAMRGFAGAATDTGHEGGSGSFALDANGKQNWQGIIDNAYLGIHEMTVVGKAVTTAFYGKAPRYSYFVGGSTGGRQGLMEAQRYPGDYDGISCACPAINWQRFVSGSLWPQMVMLANSNFVSKAKLDAATAAAIAACDGDDGVKDGVIDDPFSCKWDPKALVGTKVGNETFTEADAEVVRRTWEGPRRRDGSFMWYGLERGADMSPYAGTEGMPLKGKPFSIALEYWIYYLAQDAKWDWRTLTYAGFEALWTKSVEQYGLVIGTDNPDLTRFRDRGSKIIITHGMADQLIPAAGSVDYYKRLQQRMGGEEKTASFARLFLVPGVDHGFRGAGVTPARVPETVIRWVEEGVAPDKLLGEKRDTSGKVVRTRPLFPYPATAKYKGSGSTDEEQNFVSVRPGK